MNACHDSIRVIRAVVTSGLIIAFLPQELAAQDELASSEALLLAEIPSVFGASRFDQLATEAPASVTIITGDEIRDFGWCTVAEILRGVRGFYVTNDRNYEYVGARGFGRPGDYNSRLLLLVDGNRINENVFDSAYVGNDGPLDVQVIDRLEVIRGPSSSLYGTSAFFGVINIVTKGGRAVDGAHARVTGASFGGYEGAVTYGQRYPSGVEIMVSGLAHRYGGPNLYFPEFNDPQTNAGWAVAVDGERRDNVFCKLSWGDLTVEGGFNSRTKEVPTGSYGTIFNDPRAETVDRTGLVSLQYRTRLGDQSQVAALLSHNWYDYRGDWPYAEVLNRDGVRGRWWIAEGQWLRPLGQRHKVVLGGDARLNTRQEQWLEDVDPYYLYLHDNTTTNSWGLYAQDEFRLAERLILNAGLRHDHYQGAARATTPRLGLILGLKPGSAVKVLAGSAFRTANNYERFYDDGGIVQKPNPDLDPERIWTYELLVEHAFNPTLKATAGVYQYDIEDLITQVTDPADELLVFANAEQVRSRGTEIELGVDRAVFSARASYAYQVSRDHHTGAELTNSPRHLGKVALLVPLWRNRLRAATEVQATSARLAEDGDMVPGSVVVHLNLTALEWTPGLTVALGVRNLFDKDYADPVGAQHAEPALTQDGRTFRLSAEYDF